MRGADKTRRSAAQRRSAARQQRERQRRGRHQAAAGASDCELIGMAWSNVLNRQHGDDCTLPPVTGSATAAACSATQDMQSPASHSTTISAVEAVEAVPARMGNNTSISCTGGTARNDTFDLRQGQILPGGNAVYAADGSAFLILQNIGRLVLYRGPNQLHNKGQIWASDEQAAQPLPPAARVVAAAAGGYEDSDHSLDTASRGCFALLRHTGEFAVFRGSCPPAPCEFEHQEQGLGGHKNKKNKSKGEPSGMTKALRRCDKIWSSKSVSTGKRQQGTRARRTRVNVATEYFLTVVGSIAAGAEGMERFEIHGCSGEKGEDLGVVARFPHM